jgi:adenosylcobinamide-GDP ribazoletransferase
MLLTLRHQALLFMVAIQFLTRLPTPKFSGYRAEWLPQSTSYFPLVGVLVAIINVMVWGLASLVFPPVVAVGLMMAASLLTTGALHEDGFADSCDGFGGAADKDRVLVIMKDSHIGAYGAMGLFVMLGVKWSTLSAVPAAAFPILVLGAHMVSRWCATGVISSLPYVRSDEHAKSTAFAGGIGAGRWLVGGVIGVLAVAGVVVLCRFSPDELALHALPTAAAAALIVGVLAAAYCRRRIGGYTGDCLGAVQQLTELAFLLGGLAALGRA